MGMPLSVNIVCYILVSFDDLFFDFLSRVPPQYVSKMIFVLEVIFNLNSFASLG